MDIYLAAALGAAGCWAVAGFISAAPARHLGAIAFNRARLTFVFVLLSVFAWFSGGWESINGPLFWPLMLSGFIGVFLGDTALFLTLNRMGPRRTAILFG
ncbi:MAG: EamA family transporter, partial [Granulosicoccaceae bacterium]